MPGKLTIFRGLPGSGKSTEAQRLVQTLLSAGITAINIDRDMFRLANGFSVAPVATFEETISDTERAIIENGLLQNWNVIESSTNLNNRFLKSLVKLGTNCGAEVEIIDVNTPLDVCVERDENRRLVGGHFLGEEVLRAFAARVMPNGKFPPKPKLPEVVNGAPYVPDINRPSAIIVDIDGTVAEVDGRSPYDYTLVSTDKPKQWVIDLIQGAWVNSEQVIFMSGRDSMCRLDTVKWINRYVGENIDYKLYMRAEGDQRMDAIVKLELFNKHIRHNYNVRYCVDDRAQVIRMYRSIGLNVLDVAGHTF
jgi:predicted kinase